MRLVSLNAWGGREWDALSKWVPELGADILCLQEVTRAPVESPDWLEYNDPHRHLAQRSDLFDDISRLLPTYRASFAAAARGELRHDDGLVRSEHGIAIWSDRALAIAEARHSFVHGRFRPDGWGPEPVPRAIQAQRTWDPVSEQSILVIHFHGLRDPSGKGETPARSAQCAAVLALLADMRRFGEACVLAGDFNVLPDNPMFGELAAAGMTDLVTTAGITDTRTSLYPKSQRYDDYLLVSSEIRVQAFDVPANPEVSDHRPLILDFNL